MLSRRAVLAGLGATALVGCRRKSPTALPDPTDMQGWRARLAAAVWAEDYEAALVALQSMAPLAEPEWLRMQQLWVTGAAHRWLVMVEGALPPIVDGLVPPAGTDHRLAALDAWHQGEADAVGELMDLASPWPTSKPGEVDGVPFERLRDADDFLAPFLEVIAPEISVWVPWLDVGQVELKPGEGFLQELWIPAELSLVSGESAPVRIPLRYAGSASSEEEAVQRAEATHLDTTKGARRGLGRRVLLADEREVDLAEVRVIRFG